jgi:hypothetical protein
MSTPPIDELMKLWRKGELTAEQAAGYMMPSGGYVPVAGRGGAAAAPVGAVAG